MAGRMGGARRRTSDLSAAPYLCVIIGGKPYRGRDCLELTRAAVASGVQLVQLREKEMNTGELVALAVAMRDICRQSGALLIVNDRADVAAASGADGVHLGQEDLSLRAARALLGPGAIIGASASSLEEALAAAAAGADYLGLGPVYPTASKDCSTAPCGLGVLAEVVANVTIPVLAIGGVTPANTMPLLKAEAAGVAVITAFAGAPDPQEAVREFQEVLSEYASDIR